MRRREIVVFVAICLGWALLLLLFLGYFFWEWF